MSLRNHRSGGHGGRTRRRSKRPPPVPKKAHQDDEVYANIGPKHKLTYLRYPKGSGKRPPPKPKRSHSEQNCISSNCVPSPSSRPPVRHEYDIPSDVISIPQTSKLPLLPPKLPLSPNRKPLWNKRNEFTAVSPAKISDGVEFRKEHKLACLKTSPGKSANGDLSTEQSSLQANKPIKKPLLPPMAKPRKKSGTDVEGEVISSTPGITNGTTSNTYPASTQQKPLLPPPPTYPQRKPLIPPPPLKTSEGNKPKPPLPKPRQKKHSLEELSRNSPFHEPQPIPRESKASAVMVAMKRLENKEEVISASPTRPVPRTRVHGSNGHCSPITLTESVQDSRGQSAVIPHPPVPQKQVNNEASRENEFSVTPPSHPTHHSGLPTQRKSRKKGGGIRFPLWKAPPPPPWSPPFSPKPPPPFSPPSTSKKTECSPPLAPVQSPSSSPQHFVLPPFRSSGFSLPVPSFDTERPLDQEPPIQLSKTPVIHSLTPKIPLNFEFEENLFRNKSVGPNRSTPQKQLPFSVVQELQNNFCKQITRRSRME